MLGKGESKGSLAVMGLTGRQNHRYRSWASGGGGTKRRGTGAVDDAVQAMGYGHELVRAVQRSTACARAQDAVRMWRCGTFVRAIGSDFLPPVGTTLKHVGNGKEALVSSALEALMCACTCSKGGEPSNKYPEL